MRNKVLLTLALAVALGGVVAYSVVLAATPRADCPGAIICPLTGEEGCKDRCPLRDAQRADCPGRMECPLTGELVCRDKCPLAGATDSGEVAQPSCGEAIQPSCCQRSE